MKNDLNQVKTRPIIMSAGEVAKVKALRKTQLRLPISIPKDTGAFCLVKHRNGFWPYKSLDGESSMIDGIEHPLRCPIGKVGDQLWVREKHRPIGWNFDSGTVTIEYADGSRNTTVCYPDDFYPLDYEDLCNEYLYKITDILAAKKCPIIPNDGGDWECYAVYDSEAIQRLMPWRSPIAMPRWASRLLLEISNVRIERLHTGETDNKDSENNPWVWVGDIEVIGEGQ
ncbi:MAG: hypothetical protein Q4P13_09570 [Psychrobacter sp.]|nr:hypothetical protein [Psychrobacter sp.]